MDIETTSRLAGLFCWIETQLFEILGSWLHDGEFASGQLVQIGDRCVRHGEHAEAWRARVAAVPHLDTATLVVPTPRGAPSVGAVAVDTSFVDHLRNDHGAAAQRLAHYDSALATHLRPACVAVRAHLDPRIDGPTARLVDQVLADITTPLAR